MHWNIVIVEDSQEMIESLTAVLSRELGEVSVIGVGFGQAADRIAELMPDVVVLDIFGDELDEQPENAVVPAWDYVWNVHFCPVVFHSAHDVAAYRNLEHPFARFETKGPKSQRLVAEHIRSFGPEIDGLRIVRRELSRHVGEIMRHLGRLIRPNDRPTQGGTQLFLRMARRRMAAALDETAEHEDQIQAWEQYVYPPIGDDLLTGDVLRAREANVADPGAYRIVLSPSCDLVRGRSKTLENVLVAECVAVSDFVVKAIPQADRLTPRELRKRLRSEISKDQVAGLTILPAFSDVLPLMAANLKSLRLVPYAEIAGKNEESKPFVRVASMDSPFRERLAWAHLQVAGRPGVPDLDRESFAEAIVQFVAPIGSK